MPSDGVEPRHSRALEPELIADPQAKAEAEARNGFRQYDAAIGAIQQAIDRRAFRLRPSLIQALHREALSGISSFAGNWRPAGVAIQGSKHIPVGAHLVAELVEDMCDYVNNAWRESTAIHLAAYVMWRLNWIHPFADGNGRTSRIVSYVVMSIKVSAVLGGTPTIPEQIVADRQPYFDALDAADKAFEEGTIDVSRMEGLLSRHLAVQLASLYEQAGGSVGLDQMGEKPA